MLGSKRLVHVIWLTGERKMFARLAVRLRLRCRYDSPFGRSSGFGAQALDALRVEIRQEISFQCFIV